MELKTKIPHLLEEIGIAKNKDQGWAYNEWRGRDE